MVATFRQPFDMLAETATAAARVEAGETAKSAKTEIWLGRQDSNLGMAVPKTAALPLGDAPIACRKRGLHSRREAAGNRVVAGDAYLRAGPILRLAAPTARRYKTGLPRFSVSECSAVW